jgi:outer membrane lipoprotein-sorting protein
MKKIISLSLFGAIAFSPMLGTAQNVNQVLAGDQRAQAIKLVNDSINSLDKIEGNFVQTNSNGSQVQGNFWLDRPGKMRFEYAQPSQISLISDGNVIAIHDKKLKTVEKYPLRSNPLYFMLKANLNINQELKVTNVVKSGTNIMISVRDKNKEAQGELTMLFNQSGLSQWTIVDNRNRVTNVKLTNIKKSNVANNMFAIPVVKRVTSFGKN